jgi:hypothetical protein
MSGDDLTIPLFGRAVHAAALTTGPPLRRHLPVLTAVENGKGVLDVDTVKGCAMGMRARPDGGCYGECYANRTATRYGIDFAVSVSRKPRAADWDAIYRTVRDHRAHWYRIGTAGDPCHDWNNTLEVCEALRGTGKVPVIITKHWVALSDDDMCRLRGVSAVMNTSTSGFDTDAEIKHRVRQMERLRAFGVVSINRVVTCAFGTTEWARASKGNYTLDSLDSYRGVIYYPDHGR